MTFSFVIMVGQFGLVLTLAICLILIKMLGVVEWWKKLNLKNDAYLEEETDHVSFVLSTYGGPCGRLETISSLQGNGSNLVRKFC